MDSTDFPQVRLMSDPEQDRELAVLFRQLAEDDAAEKARYCAKAAFDAPDPEGGAAEAETALSPEWSDVKKRLMAAMLPKKRLAPVAAASTPAGLETAAPASMHADVPDSRVESEIKVVPLHVESTPGDVIALTTPVTDLTRFPASKLNAIMELEDPLKSMADLCKQLLMHKDYLRVRDDYCRLSISRIAML